MKKNLYQERLESLESEMKFSYNPKLGGSENEETEGIQGNREGKEEMFLARAIFKIGGKAI